MGKKKQIKEELTESESENEQSDAGSENNESDASESESGSDASDNESDSGSDASDEESETDSEAKVPEKTKDKIKKMIQTWMLLDDKIKEMDKQKKEYREKKKQQELIIIDVMSKYEFDECKSGKNKITKTVSKSRGGLKPEIIKAGLLDVLKDEKKADLLVTKILDKRPVVERTYLKRTKERKGK